MINTNSPPTPGFLNVNPSSGIELSTLFELISSSWEDVDLPLTYRFGLYDRGEAITLQEASARNFASRLLFGSGLAKSNYTRSTFVITYDSLKAYTTLTKNVQVTELTANSSSTGDTAKTERLKLIDKIANASTLSSESILKASPAELKVKAKTIVAISAALNQVDCTLPTSINCTILNRIDCEKTEKTFIIPLILSQRMINANMFYVFLHICLHFLIKLIF